MIFDYFARGYTIFLTEAAGEILGVVEADFISNFRNVHRSAAFQHFFGDGQAEGADKLGRRLPEGFLHPGVEQGLAHTHRTAECINV